MKKPHHLDLLTSVVSVSEVCPRISAGCTAVILVTSLAVLHSPVISRTLVDGLAYAFAEHIATSGD
jgi:hypothetical protein